MWLFREGLPRGSVLAPLLFALCINVLPDHLPSDCTPFLYADDLAIAVQGLTVEEAEAKVQVAIDAVTEWATE